MSSGIVLSIHSIHARNIYTGIKRYEYRTRRPAKDIEYIALYETGGPRAITGIAKIAGILESTPAMIWDLTKSFAGISCDFFRDYFAGKRKAVAYCISEVIPFEKPVVLSEIGIERAPQSFQYIDELTMKKLIEVELENKKPLLPRFFVGGVHGVGKSTFVKTLAIEMGLTSYTASRIIANNASVSSDKLVLPNEVLSNQDSLLAGLHETEWFTNGGLLDGHFVLQTRNGDVSRLPFDVFKRLNLDALFVLTSKPSDIAERLKARDGIDWDVRAIERMQQEETLHAKQVSENLGIPLSILRR